MTDRKLGRQEANRTAHRARAIARLMLVAVIILSGCQPSEDVATEQTATPPTVTTTTSPMTAATPTEAKSEPDSTDGWVPCDNTDAGYRVEHPPDWKTNPGDVLPPCSLFDPGDVDVERGTEIPFDIAVALRAEPVPLSRTTERNRGEEEISREETTIAGRDAVRREVEATQEAPLRPPGLRSTYWYVSLGDGQTLVASTHDAGELPYTEKQDVLDRMVHSLELDGG